MSPGSRSCSGATVIGNYVGPNPAGTAALPNSIQGILLQGGTATIGGPGSGEGNVVSGNSGNGVRLLNPSAGTTVRGNRIGVGPVTADMGNGGSGVEIFGADDVTIGGVAANEGNEIAYNALGIRVEFTLSGGTGNAIRQNSIHDNDGLGIDLGGDGVTPNDVSVPVDGDSGANDLLNFPGIDSATFSESTLSVDGHLDVTGAIDPPVPQYTIELFASPTCDSSLHGEGATYLGSVTVSPDGGNYPWSFGLGSTSLVGVGDVVTATTTDASGNTSEFSDCLTVSPGGDLPPTVSLTEPLAGALLRGTGTVSADATDDVGVESVEFVYSAGGPDVSIATDTTAPYSASFDSTTVATRCARCHDLRESHRHVRHDDYVDRPCGHRRQPAEPGRLRDEPRRQLGDLHHRPVGKRREQADEQRSHRHPPVALVDGSLITWQRGSEIWLMKSG